MLAFQFTVDEINMILTGLADQPYKNVAQLVSKIHSQANPQIQAGPFHKALHLPIPGPIALPIPSIKARAVKSWFRPVTQANPLDGLG